ncbi:MAG: hypothetical protein ABIO70_12695 [Pseudomonadota bacterium]
MRLAPFLLLLSSACNVPPGTAVVGIEPDAPRTTDDLAAVIVADAPDEDGDTLTYTFTWHRDAEVVTTGPTLAAAETAKHETWKVVVVPNDGTEDGPPSEASVTIANTPPGASVTLSPGAPLTTEDIAATAEGWDDDNDVVELTYDWLLGGEVTSYHDFILPAAATERGQVWTARITPNDGEEDGAPATAEVSIENAAPVVQSVVLGPSEAYEGSTLTAAAEARDADGDEITLSYAWIVDGVLVQEGAELTLTGEHFDKHQEVVVTVTPNDGFVDGEAVSSAAVTVRNTPPAAPGVTITPAPAYVDEDLVCTLTHAATDADGDPLETTFAWTVDGAPFTGAETTTWAGDTIPWHVTLTGETWVCSVSARDGEGDGAAGTDSAMVATRFSGWSPSSWDLSAADYTFLGEEAGAWAGASLAMDGDVDGDGYDDVLIGAPREDGAGVDAGAVYLVRGASLGAWSGTSLAGADCTLWGEDDGDLAGAALSYAGDLDADGRDDLLISAHGDDTLATDAGCAYLVFGSSLGTARSFDLGSADLILLGADPGGGAGYSNTGGHDADGDGVPDLFIGALYDDTAGVDAGSLSFFSGAGLGSTGASSLALADATLLGQAPGDEFGHAAASLADVDGDGLGDLLVGSYLSDAVGTDSGQAYFFSGATLAAGGTLDAADADLLLPGGEADENAGVAVAGAGDVDGDGSGDLLVGAWHGSDAGTYAGHVYLLLASSLSTGTLPLSRADCIILGGTAQDHLGRAVAGAGDIDTDGRAEILAGAYGQDDGGETAGATYLFMAPTLLAAGTLDAADADYSFIGETAWDFSGLRLAGDGDVDGDGMPDILIGATYHSSYTGKVHLLLTP